MQQILEIGNGYQGTRDTLKIMAGVARQASADPAIRMAAASLVRSLPSKAFTAEIVACFEFVRDNIRYLQDPVSMERLEYPADLLKTGQGDCDDMCTLLAALLDSIGHPSRFCAVGYQKPGQFEHVYLETRIGSQWMALDPTEQVEAGWAPLRPYVDVTCHAMLKEYV